MKAFYKTQELEIIDEHIESGYMSDKVLMVDLEGNEIMIGGSKNRTIQVFLSLPHDDEFLLEEAIQLDNFLQNATVSIFAYLIFASKPKNLPTFERLVPLIDVNDIFSLQYGVKIESEYLLNHLTKALYIIGKDGAIFYDWLPSHLEEMLDFDIFTIEMNRAFNAYTGVGCH